MSQDDPLGAFLARVPEPYRTELKRETDSLANTLSSTKDMMLLILKFHVFAQRLMERFILLKLPRADRLVRRARLSFAQKLALVNAFDLVHDSAIQAMAQVNRLRNECAHVHGTEIKEEDIDRIGQPFGRRYREFKHKSLNDYYKILLQTLAEIYGHFSLAYLKADGMEFMNSKNP